MGSGKLINPISVVIDANVIIAICAKEADKLANADAKIKEYASNGCRFYAPSVIVSECLYVFCRKLSEGVLTAAEHASAIQALITIMAAIDPPPNGDRSLIQRAESFRGNLGCSHSADGIYIALAHELSSNAATEIVTFDNKMKNQAAAIAGAPIVVVLPTV
jgi:predicted nucleic acid-binding protein